MKQGIRVEKFISLQKCKQGGVRVREHTWLFFRITDPEQGYPVPVWSMLPWYPWCVSLKFPNLPARIPWQFWQISTVQKLYLECRLSVALGRALLRSMFIAEDFLGDLGF